MTSLLPRVSGWICAMMKQKCAASKISAKLIVAASSGARMVSWEGTEASVTREEEMALLLGMRISPKDWACSIGG